MILSFIFSGVILGALLALLILVKKKKGLSDYILFSWLLITGLHLFFYYTSFDPNLDLPKGVQLLLFSIPMLSGPTLYLYISSISRNNVSIKTIAIHSLWYVIYVTTLLFLFPHVDLEYGFLIFNETIPPSIQYSILTALAISGGAYAILSLRTLLSHKKNLQKNFSYTEKINLDWLKWIVISFVSLFIILFFLIKYGVSLEVFELNSLFKIVGATLTVYVLLMGFFGLRQSSPFVDMQASLNTEVKPKKSYGKSGLNDKDIEEIYQHLLSFMDEKQPYLQDDLNMQTLSSLLQTKSNYLSQVINQKAGMNFFNFVNSYRINEVKEKLKDPKFDHLSVLGIAFESGFRSKASFNKLFKNQVGMTPTEYKKSINK